MAKDNRERKKKLMSISIIFIMVVSTLGVMLFGFSSSDSGLDYNGFKFLQSGNNFVLKLDGTQYKFYFHPTQLDSISFNDSARIGGAKIVGITYDPSSPFKQELAIAQYGLGKVLEEKGAIVVYGFTNNGGYDVPMITCSNSSLETPVIYFEEGNQTQLSFNEGCLKATSYQGWEFIALSERVQYSVLGVIN